MNIIFCKVYKYSLSLNYPLVVKGINIPQREGFIIHLHAQGEDGFGEVSCLKGFSQETIEDNYKQLIVLREKIKNIFIPERIGRLTGEFSHLFRDMHLNPSVVCGLEMAILNLKANILKRPVFALVSHSFYPHISLSGLLQGSIATVQQQAQKLLSEGFVSMKLKVGTSFKEDVEKVLAVQGIIKEKALLHLDANQTWELDEAVSFINQVGYNCIHYIEEPLKDVHKIPAFYQHTLIPVALDESLRHLSEEDIKRMEGVDYIVLKPTVLGGIEKCWQMMQRYKEAGIHPVVSSSFETSLGILALAQLGSLSDHQPTAGLDTLKWFKEDIFIKPLSISKGRFHIEGRFVRKEDINIHLLEEIP